MIRDMTIGQYYNVDSIVHRLDPRVKIIFTLIYVITLFFSRNPLLYLIAFLVLCGYIKLSNVPVSFVCRGLRGVAMIILFTVVINLFTVQGVKIIFQWKFIKITVAGLKSAIYLGLRLSFIIIGSSMMTYTTTPNALTDGLEKMLGWMKKIRVPVHEIALIMAIALRFVPILVEELDKIMKAQMARGIDFKEGNIFVRLQKLVSVLIPLFVSAIKRSNELALAMEARCYHGGDGRTRMKPLHYKKLDKMAYVFIMLYFIVMIAVAIA